jgi:hypothetical protein
MSDEVLKIASNGQWTLEKSKLIKPKQLSLPKSIQFKYLEQNRDFLIGSTRNTGMHYPKQDSIMLGAHGLNDDREEWGHSNYKDVLHHEHQHRLLDLAAKQLSFSPEVREAERGRALATHLWNSSGISSDEKQALQHVMDASRAGFSVDDDHHETLANVTGWLNAGPERRQALMARMKATPEHVDKHIRSIFSKLQRTALGLRPGDSISIPESSGTRTIP